MECHSILNSLTQRGFKIIPPKELPEDQIVIHFLEGLQESGVIARNIIRDIKIRRIYKRLRGSGKSSPDAIFEIEQTKFTDERGESFYLGEDTIKNILFSKKRRYE